MKLAPPVTTGAVPVPPPPAAPAATAPAGAPPAVPQAAPKPTGAPNAPVQPEAPTDPAAAKAAVIDKLMKTSAQEAISEVDAHLAKVASLSVGGGTPEGTQGAKVASALLTDASMLLQHAHTKALEQIRTLAGELHLKLMSSASGLAYMGGQVAIAGQSKQPVKLAEIAAGPIAETKATMAEVVAALGATAKAAPAPATPAAPAAANGNGGVAGPAVPAPTPNVAPAPAPGKGPNPA